MPETLFPEIRERGPTPYTLQPKPYNLHPTPYNLDPKPGYRQMHRDGRVAVGDVVCSVDSTSTMRRAVHDVAAMLEGSKGGSGFGSAVSVHVVRGAQVGALAKGQVTPGGETIFACVMRDLLRDNSGGGGEGVYVGITDYERTKRESAAVLPEMGSGGGWDASVIDFEQSQVNARPHSLADFISFLDARGDAMPGVPPLGRSKAHSMQVSGCALHHPV